MSFKNTKTHCAENLLLGYLEQQLSAADEAALESHLEDCAICRQRMDQVAADDAAWSDAQRLLKADQFDGALSLSGEAWTQILSKADQSAAELTAREVKRWLDPTDDPRMLGRFGGYEITGIVGQGGMGVVLKGFEASLNRFVAIKVLAPHLATSGAARQRFAREAQAAAAVLHENVISIHRVAESHDLPYLVMPYIGGVSLQKRIDDEGPLPLAAVLRISRQIAAGLAAAHAQGLVHRDIKPANILLERGVERVTITDFGLARAADDGSLTKTGVIAGTPHYMSPEQSRGEAVDARSDLFSLGSVMYAMCTGHPPFRAETGYGILRRITDDQPRPIREINSDVPEWFAEIVNTLHAKSRGERFQKADEVGDLLEQCLAHLQQPAVSPLPNRLRGSSRTLSQRQKRWLMASACMVGAIALGILTVISQNSGRPHRGQISEGRAAASSDSAQLDWDGVSDNSLQSLRRDLLDFQDRSSQEWSSPDSNDSNREPRD